MNTYIPSAGVRASDLRKAMTPTELRLWAALRAKRLNGLKFRRQHPIGPYIVDFCCVSHRLIVEVDGPGHSSLTQHDNKRDAYLQSLGYMIIRFQNPTVLTNLPWILRQIVQAADSNTRNGDL
ncbi:MAG TPA: DUF559 domain-containing protein [Capsulimonadaceae bacterium]|jgi:very-short-patch-repair endonuclease